jgi:hypothetical protein
MREGCCDCCTLAGNIAIGAAPARDARGYDGSECGVAVHIIGTVLPRFHLNRGINTTSACELAHEYFPDRSARSAWDCIRRRSASKSDDGLRHGRLYHAVGQLPQCRLTHRIRDRRNLRLLLQVCVLIRRTVTIPDTVGVSLLTNAVCHSAWVCLTHRIHWNAARRQPMPDLWN